MPQSAGRAKSRPDIGSKTPHLCAPFALAWVAAGKVKTILSAQLIILAAVVAAVGFSIAVYWPTFVDNAKPDAQDGLVLLFVPIYQLAGIALAIMAANFVARRFAKT